MTCKVIADKNKPIKILDCGTNNVFSLENKEEALKFCDALNVTLNYVKELIDAKVELKKENNQLKKQCAEQQLHINKSQHEKAGLIEHLGKLENEKSKLQKMILNDNKEQKYFYGTENGNIHILTEDDLPKCPKTGEISPSVWIIGEKKKEIPVEHINCRCSGHIFCKDIDEDFRS